MHLIIGKRSQLAVEHEVAHKAPFISWCCSEQVRSKGWHQMILCISLSDKSAISHFQRFGDVSEHKDIWMQCFCTKVEVIMYSRQVMTWRYCFMLHAKLNSLPTHPCNLDKTNLQRLLSPPHILCPGKGHLQPRCLPCTWLLSNWLWLKLILQWPIQTQCHLCMIKYPQNNLTEPSPGLRTTMLFMRQNNDSKES